MRNQMVRLLAANILNFPLNKKNVKDLIVNFVIVLKVGSTHDIYALKQDVALLLSFTYPLAGLRHQLHARMVPSTVYIVKYNKHTLPQNTMYIVHENNNDSNAFNCVRDNKAHLKRLLFAHSFIYSLAHSEIWHGSWAQMYVWYIVRME